MTASVTVDARGLRCPLPVIRLAQAARDLAPGSEVVLLATDPAARADVPAWARLRGHSLVSTVDEGEHTAYAVVTGSATPEGEPPAPRPGDGGSPPD